SLSSFLLYSFLLPPTPHLHPLSLHDALPIFIEPDVNVMQGADETPAGPERGGGTAVLDAVVAEPVVISVLQDEHREPFVEIRARDRKSTRLNSSHGSISYAVFCLKKKTNNKA